MNTAPYRLVTSNFNTFYIVKTKVYRDKAYDGFRPIYKSGSKKEVINEFEKVTGLKYEDKYEYKLDNPVVFEENIKPPNEKNKEFKNVSIGIRKNFQGTIFNMELVIENNICKLLFDGKSYKCKISQDKKYVFVKQEIELKSGHKTKTFGKFKIPTKEQSKLTDYDV
jgi:hypothetical protein